MPFSIAFDYDSRFASHFWDALQVGLGTRLKFSTVLVWHLMRHSMGDLVGLHYVGKK